MCTCINPRIHWTPTIFHIVTGSQPTHRVIYAKRTMMGMQVNDRNKQTVD